MRYSIVFAALVAVATSAPIDLTVGGLDVSVGNVAGATTTQTTTGKRGIAQVPDITVAGINTPKINAKRDIGTEVSFNSLITSITVDIVLVRTIATDADEELVAPVVSAMKALDIAVGLNIDLSPVTTTVKDIDVKSLVAGIKIKVDSLASLATVTVSPEVEPLVAELVVYVDALKDGMGLSKRELVSSVTGTVGGVVGGVEKTAGGVVGDIKREVDLSNVDGIVGGAVKDVTGIVGNIKRDTVVDADNVIKPVTGVVGGVVVDIKPVTGVVGNIKRDTVIDADTVLTPGMGTVSGVVTDVKPATDVVSGVVSDVKRQADGVLTTVEGLTGPIVGDVTETVGNLKRQVELSSVTSVVTGVESTVDGITKPIIDDIKRNVDLSEVTGDVSTIESEAQTLVPSVPGVGVPELPSA